MVTRARQPRRGLTANVLSVFAAAWLLLALQPCMAAFETAAPDAHHGDCPHCPVVVEHGCMDGGPIECDPFEATVPTQAAPHADLLADIIAAPPFVLTPLQPDGINESFRPPGATGPPLTTRFCCFLE